jgi:hypothetical protein
VELDNASPESLLQCYRGIRVAVTQLNIGISSIQKFEPPVIPREIIMECS